MCFDRSHFDETQLQPERRLYHCLELSVTLILVATVMIATDTTDKVLNILPK